MLSLLQISTVQGSCPSKSNPRTNNQHTVCSGAFSAVVCLISGMNSRARSRCGEPSCREVLVAADDAMPARAARLGGRWHAPGSTRRQAFPPLGGSPKEQLERRAPHRRRRAPRRQALPCHPHRQLPWLFVSEREAQLTRQADHFREDIDYNGTRLRISEQGHRPAHHAGLPRPPRSEAHSAL